MLPLAVPWLVVLIAPSLVAFSPTTPLLAPVRLGFNREIEIVGGRVCLARVGHCPLLMKTKDVAAKPEKTEGNEVLQQILVGRRTINDFETELPKNWKSAVKTAVKAAIYAPNHKRTEPWRFHLLGKEGIKAVCELNSKMVAAKKGEKAGEAKLKRWLAIPGWLVVTQHAPDADDADMQKPNSVLREDYAACCCAVQNLCLSLHSQGIGTKWTTGDVNFDSGFRTAADIPADEHVVGTVWFGRAAKTPDPPKKKMTVDDVLTEHK